uniref:Osmotin thaumatin-like protein n=1 Tax=Mycena chlorophos TaxID=658473 RepID=A0ABQ0LVV2_MYCCL|nr:predicted protein [Mycena chlorophos]
MSLAAPLPSASSTRSSISPTATSNCPKNKGPRYLAARTGVHVCKTTQVSTRIYNIERRHQRKKIYKTANLEWTNQPPSHSHFGRVGLETMFSSSRVVSFAALAAVAAAAPSLHVDNLCPVSVFLFTQTSFGSISNNVHLAAGEKGHGMDISSNWDGAINVGTGCNSDGTSCTTGGPQWDGVTPFSRAEFNYYAIPGSVTYDISLIYGFNVGMKITSAKDSCAKFSCAIGSAAGCPVPGPGAHISSCYSPCCSNKAACAGGALPAGGGGCVNNAGPGPHSPFYYNHCPNAYAFPDNDGADGYKPADFVDYTCDNTAITLTLCPGTTSHLNKRSFSEVHGQRDVEIIHDEA